MSGSRHWSDLPDILFPVTSVVLLLSQGQDDWPGVLQVSILNDEGHSLRLEPLGRALTPLPQFSAEFLNVRPKERLTLYLTSSRAKLEGQQRRSLGDMRGEREVLLDGGRGEQRLCALMNCSSVATSGTMWLSLQEKLDCTLWP